MAVNAWATPSDPPSNDVPTYAVPQINSYTVPAPGAPYVPNTGWSPVLRDAVGSTPDPGRLGTEPLFQDYPVPNRPPEESYRPRDADRARRHSVEEISATGFNEEIGADSGPRFAPNPRATPPMPTRVTSFMSPHKYAFFRNMGVGQPKADTPHALNGVHFSMADHRRDYPILGMSAQRKPGSGTRNTYRLTPAPWDVNIVDYPPPAAQGLPMAEVQAPTGSTSLTRSGRLL